MSHCRHPRGGKIAVRQVDGQRPGGEVAASDASWTRVSGGGLRPPLSLLGPSDAGSRTPPCLASTGMPSRRGSGSAGTRWMAANVAVAQDPAGNLKPAKDNTPSASTASSPPSWRSAAPWSPRTSRSPSTPCSLSDPLDGIERRRRSGSRRQPQARQGQVHRADRRHRRPHHGHRPRHGRPGGAAALVLLFFV
jgi:hypothetical protein